LGPEPALSRHAGEGGGDAVVVADGASDPHQAAPDRLGIAFTYVTDGGLTSPWS
jgi:hypothetical protein